MPTSFLGLSGWTVNSVTETPDGAYAVEATFDLQPFSCPKCGVVDEFYRHGTLRQRVNDTTHAGKPVVILWDRQRYRCKACGSTFLQPSTDVDDNHLMTKRLVSHIRKAVLHRTYTSVAKEVGLSDSTVRNVFYAYAEEMERKIVFTAPEILGIDEIHLRKKARCVLTNIGEGLILDMLEDYTKAHVLRGVMRLESRQNVRVVAMDMHRPYLTVTKQVFPKAVAVVDKFHVVKEANKSLDALRKLVGKNMSRRRGAFVKRNRFVLLRRPWDLTDEQRLLLSEWLTEIPALKAAYDLKERFFDIYEANTISEARKALHGWRAAIPAELMEYFGKLVKTTANWEDEILNYFATGGVTNAFTESTNRTLRDKDRVGRGYSFEVLRIKALLAHGDIVRRRPARLSVRDSVGFLTEPGEAIGVPLSTFARELSDHDEAS